MRLALQSRLDGPDYRTGAHSDVCWSYMLNWRPLMLTPVPIARPAAGFKDVLVQVLRLAKIKVASV